ncbi:MAG TPA: hypothetical protein VFD70_25360 [Anaerolineae bacterium]|nr:hypothetical protein [Anaerolineae bacterium]
MSKTSQPIRPTLPAMRVMLIVAALLVFTVGIPLNLLPLQTDRFFAWTIATPLTAAFLGAAYWSSGVLEFLASREHVWVRARIAVPAVFLFTILTLIVTLIHRDRFHFDSPDFITRSGTWVWLLVYTTVPIILGVLWLLQARAPRIDPPRAFPMPAWLRVAAFLQAVIMIPVGIALLIAPEAMATVWPWSLTPLTGRAIGAWIVSIGVAAAQAAWENDLERVRVATMSYIAIGVLELIALIRFAGDMNWATAAAWVYIVFLVSFIAVGLGGWLAARKAK